MQVVTLLLVGVTLPCVVAVTITGTTHSCSQTNPCTGQIDVNTPTGVLSIKCIGENSCRAAVFKLNTDVETEISCVGNTACADTTFTVVGTPKLVKIDCVGTESCKGAEFMADKNIQAVVQCTALNSCLTSSWSVLNGALRVDCTADRACQDIDIETKSLQVSCMYPDCADSAAIFQWKQAGSVTVKCADKLSCQRVQTALKPPCNGIGKVKCLCEDTTTQANFPGSCALVNAPASPSPPPTTPLVVPPPAPPPPPPPPAPAQVLPLNPPVSPSPPAPVPTQPPTAPPPSPPPPSTPSPTQPPTVSFTPSTVPSPSNNTQCSNLPLGITVQQVIKHTQPPPSGTPATPNTPPPSPNTPTSSPTALSPSPSIPPPSPPPATPPSPSVVPAPTPARTPQPPTGPLNSRVTDYPLLSLGTKVTMSPNALGDATMLVDGIIGLNTWKVGPHAIGLTDCTKKVTLTVDLTKQQNIRAISIITYGSEYCSRSIELSTDGGLWSTVVNTGAQYQLGTDGKIDTHWFSSVQQARYVQYTSSKSTNDDSMGVVELLVYGDPQESCDLTGMWEDNAKTSHKIVPVNTYNKPLSTHREYTGGPAGTTYVLGNSGHSQGAGTLKQTLSINPMDCTEISFATATGQLVWKKVGEVVPYSSSAQKYVYYADLKDWSSAVAFCQGLSPTTQLVTINSKAEYDYIRSQGIIDLSSNTSKVWINLQKSSPSTGFGLWADTSTKPVEYYDWFYGNPIANDMINPLDCVVLKHDTTRAREHWWQNVPCSQLNACICETKVVTKAKVIVQQVPQQVKPNQNTGSPDQKQPTQAQAGQTYDTGDVVMYTCPLNNGTIRAVRCNLNGEWNNTAPFCPAEPTCNRPSVSSELLITTQGSITTQTTFKASTEIGFGCYTGFVSGVYKTTCMHNGQWENPAPQCRQATKTEPLTIGTVSALGSAISGSIAAGVGVGAMVPSFLLACTTRQQTKSPVSIILRPFFFLVNTGNSDGDIVCSTLLALVALMLLHSLVAVVVAKVRHHTFGVSCGIVKFPSVPHVAVVFVLNGLAFSSTSLLSKPTSVSLKCIGILGCIGMAVYLIVFLSVLRTIAIPNLQHLSFDTTPSTKNTIHPEQAPSFKGMTKRWLAPQYYWVADSRPYLIEAFGGVLRYVNKSRHSYYAEPVHFVLLIIQGALSGAPIDCSILGYVLVGVGVLRFLLFVVWRNYNTITQVMLLATMQGVACLQLLFASLLVNAVNIPSIMVTVMTIIFMVVTMVYIVHSVYILLLEYFLRKKLTAIEKAVETGDLSESVYMQDEYATSIMDYDGDEDEFVEEDEFLDVEEAGDDYENEDIDNQQYDEDNDEEWE